MKKLVLTLLSLFFFCSFSTAQSEDSFNWFPYKTGDMWEYTVYLAIDLPPDTAQIINIKDSALADGKIHLTQQHRFINPITEEYFLRYIVDTVRGEVREPLTTGDPPQTTLMPRYRFDIQQGDKWVMYDNGAPPGGFRYEMARVVELYAGRVFGANTTLMRMGYYLAQDSTDSSGLGREGRLLAKGFGLIESVPSEGGYHYYLKGAVINGTLYGDTTNVITSVLREPTSDRPREFELYQNYPNPFNPTTEIRFSLAKPSDVRLEIYDIMGRVVATLIQAPMTAGYHKVAWEGKDNAGQMVSSGVYFYRITAGEFVATKKMVVIK